jgi:hypothetical protein
MCVTGRRIIVIYHIARPGRGGRARIPVDVEQPLVGAGLLSDFRRITVVSDV